MLQNMFAVVTTRACELQYWATLYLMPETKEKIGTGGKGNAGSEIYNIKCYVAIKNECAIAAYPQS